MMQRGPVPAEQMVSIIETFPSQIKDLAQSNQLSSPSHNEGPFPLSHDDFLHSNIMVDSNFNVTGIIDWEGACTVPHELVAFPDFLTAMPVPFDLPRNYASNGQPIDADVREVWRERGEYIEMVKAAERELRDEVGVGVGVEAKNGDGLLSICLSSKKIQTIAYCYGAYTSIGKLGFYDRVVEELERGME